MMPNTKRSNSSYYVRKRLKVTYSVALWYRSGLYRKSHRSYLPKTSCRKTNLSAVMEALENADDVSSRNKKACTPIHAFSRDLSLSFVSNIALERLNRTTVIERSWSLKAPKTVVPCLHYQGTTRCPGSKNCDFMVT